MVLASDLPLRGGHVNALDPVVAGREGHVVVVESVPGLRELALVLGGHGAHRAGHEGADDPVRIVRCGDRQGHPVGLGQRPVGGQFIRDRHADGLGALLGRAGWTAARTRARTIPVSFFILTCEILSWRSWRLLPGQSGDAPQTGMEHDFAGHVVDQPGSFPRIVELTRCSKRHFQRNGIRQTAARSLPRPPWPVCPAVPALRTDRGLRAPNASRTQAARKARVQRPRATLALWPVCSAVAGLRPSHRFDRRSPELARLARQTASQGRHKTGSATQARCVRRDSRRPRPRPPGYGRISRSVRRFCQGLCVFACATSSRDCGLPGIAELPGTGEPDRKERRFRPPAFAIARSRIGVRTESGELSPN